MVVLRNLWHKCNQTNENLPKAKQSQLLLMCRVQTDPVLALLRKWVSNTESLEQLLVSSKGCHAELSTHSVFGACVCMSWGNRTDYNVTLPQNVNTHLPLILYRKLENSTHSLCHMTALLSAKTSTVCYLLQNDLHPHTHKTGWRTHTHTQSPVRVWTLNSWGLAAMGIGI